MFVCSVKKRTALAALAGAAVFLAAIVVLLTALSGFIRPVAPLTAEYLAEFLADAGWEVDPTPIAEREVTLPAEMEDTLAQYNELLRREGYDLTPYLGETVRCTTFAVRNYPNEEREVVAHLFTSDDKIIGGDIACTALDGFLHGIHDHPQENGS